MRGWRRDVRLLTMLVDLVAIIVSFNATRHLRVALNGLFEAQISDTKLHFLIPPLGLVLILWIAAAPWLDLYRPRRGPALVTHIGQVVEAMGLVIVLTIVTTFFLRDFGTEFSRSFVLLFAPMGVVTMLAGRAAVRLALKTLGARALGPQRILVVGAGKQTRSLIKRLERTAKGAVRLCGVVTPEPGQGAGVLGNPVPIVGCMDELPVLINRHRADRVVAVRSEIDAEALQSCIGTCTRMGVPVSHTAGILHEVSARIGLTEIGTVRLVELKAAEFTRLQDLSKRAFDLAGAALLLAAASPLMALLAALIRTTSRGPAFYVAPRVGRGGRYFMFFKFRTMVDGADAKRQDLAGKNERAGHLFKIHDDPRVTRLGRWMRRYSLDELPQLLNVLMGNMSLVGPRPLPSSDLDPDGLSSQHRTWARERAKVRPGITGLWQVRGRQDNRFETMIEYDVRYVRNWSFRLDLQILMETLPAMLTGRGAC